jgi:Cytochrome P460
MSVLNTHANCRLEGTEMKSQPITASLIVTASLFLVTVLVAGQDRFTLTSPDSIVFSEFRGYDAWQVISPSHLDGGVKAIVGNPVMIKAFSEGIPVNGQPVPDGAIMAKIEWSSKNNPRSARRGEGDGHAQERGIHGERRQTIPRDERLGIRPVRVRRRVGHVQTAWQRAWVREGRLSPMPYAVCQTA